MTLDDIGNWLTKVEERVIRNENDLIKAKEAIKTLTERVSVLEEARKVQKQLNAEYSAGLTKPKMEAGKKPFKFW